MIGFTCEAGILFYYCSIEDDGVCLPTSTLPPGAGKGGGL
jgi:hypothetical protein